MAKPFYSEASLGMGGVDGIFFYLVPTPPPDAGRSVL